MVKDTTLKRREALFSKMIDKGIQSKEAINYSIKEWNSKFGTKIRTNDSLNAQKRLLPQISQNRTDVIDEYLNKRKITNPNVIKFTENEGNRLLGKKIKTKEQKLAERREKYRDKKLVEQVKKEIKAKKLKKAETDSKKRKGKFMILALTIKDVYGYTEKDAILRTRDLLKVPKRDYNKLRRRERDILAYYGY